MFFPSVRNAGKLDPIGKAKPLFRLQRRRRSHFDAFSAVAKAPLKLPRKPPPKIPTWTFSTDEDDESDDDEDDEVLLPPAYKEGEEKKKNKKKSPIISRGLLKVITTANNSDDKSDSAASRKNVQRKNFFPFNPFK